MRQTKGGVWPKPTPGQKVRDYHGIFNAPIVASPGGETECFVRPKGIVKGLR